MDELVEKLKEAALCQGKRLLGSQRFLKVIAHPVVMKTVMNSISLAGKVRGRVRTRMNRMGLGLTDEVAALRRSVDSLESTVAELRAEINGKDHP